VDALPPEDDWFDAETEEAPGRRWRPLPERPAARGAPTRRKRRHPPRVPIARARLLAAVAVFVFVVVLIASVVGGEDAGAADRAYLTSLAGPARDSEAVGAQFAALLSPPKLTKATLDSALAELIRRQERDTALASAINPAPRLRSVHTRALDALRLRDSGLTGLLAAFRAAEAKPKSAWAAALAAQANRLVASDVIWQDLFQAPAQMQIERDGVHGSTVPNSRFVTNPNLASASSMARVLAKLEGAAAPSGALSVLKLGDTGPAVRDWQRELNKWLAHHTGAKPLSVDAKFGQATLAATEQFQTSAGITADGIVGPATRRALAKALSG
jgi:hypothetical protein